MSIANHSIKSHSLWHLMHVSYTISKHGFSMRIASMSNMCQSRFNNRQRLGVFKELLVIKRRSSLCIEFYWILFSSPLLLHVALVSKKFNADWMQIIIVYSSLLSSWSFSFAFRFSNLFAIEMGQMITPFFSALCSYSNHHMPLNMVSLF